MPEQKLLTKKGFKADEWISRDEAIKLLGIKSTTFTNYLIKGKIPQRFISKTVTGSKFFYRPGLLGFDN